MSHPDDNAIEMYLDGDASPLRKLWMRIHLRLCPACRRRVEECRGDEQFMTEYRKGFLEMDNTFEELEKHLDQADGNIMKKQTSHRSDAGTVMLEYLVINFWFFLVLALSGYFFLTPDGQDGATAGVKIDVETGAITATGSVPRWGRLGDAFLSHYRTSLQIVSMPFP